MVQPITYATFKAAQSALEFQVKAASDAIRAIPGHASGPMGLTPDDVKFSRPYQEARAAYDRAFSALQQHNMAYCQAFKKERIAERDAKRAANKGRIFNRG
jgi:hypothetical protein